MSYLCKHCGARFSATEARPRCPSCLRITTVVPDKDGPATARPVGRGGEPAAAAAHHPGPPPDAPGRKPPLRPAPPLASPPWPLWVGAAIMAATLCGVYGTAFDTMTDGERLGAAGTFAALGGAGFALALRGLLKWRPWR